MEVYNRPYPRTLISTIFDGYLLMPVLMALGREGLIDKLLTGGLDTQTIHGNASRLNACYFYLESRGLIRRDGEMLYATELGQYVLKRLPAFGVAYSYDEYMRRLPELLFEPDSAVHVDRAENVLATGGMNQKYFRQVEARYRGTQASYLLDVGCGDGTNLAYALSCNPKLRAIGVDFEDASLKAAKKRFSQMELEHEPIFFHGNVRDPASIVSKLRDLGIAPSEVMTTVWFIFHEVLGASDFNLTEVLNAYAPLAQHALIIGEIFSLPPDFLAEHAKFSATAAFLFIHYLSGQCPIAVADWRANISASELEAQDFLAVESIEGECRTGVWVLTAKRV